MFYEETRPYFATTYQFLLQRFKEIENNNFELALHRAVSDTHIPLETIRSEEIRIVYVLTGPEMASKIMCLADHMGLVSPNIQWLFFGRDFSEFRRHFSEFRRHVSFNYGSTNYTCMEERMRKALLMNLFMNFKLIPFERDFDRMTIAGITYNEFKDMYNERLMKSGYEMNIWGPIAYDAVWSLALCLNNTVDKINLTDYGPGQWKSSKLIRECFNTLHFTGVSGDILFDPQTGFIDRTVDIYQTFALYYGAYYTDRMLTKLKSLQVIPDSYQNKILQFWDISAVFLFLAVSFCLLIITSHVLTIAYGSYHSIKASSPKITHFIFVGCYMLTVGTVLYSLSIGTGVGSFNNLQVDGWICQISFGYFFPIGFTLIFASVLVRTWRLYRIFIHYLDPGIFINEKFLITVICCMVGVDVLIGVVWSAIDPLVGEFVTVEFTEDSDGLLVKEVFVSCTSDYYYFWLALVFGYRFVEVIPVFVLALLTRSIRSKDFSTKRVRVYVYLISMGFLIIVPVYFISGGGNRNSELLLIVNYVSLCLLLVYFLAFSLFVLFIPPLVPLFKDKLPGFKGKYEMLKRAKRRISFPGVITLTKSETVTSSTTEN